MTVYAVVLDGRGAHEPEAVYSLWSTPTLAEAEIARLTAASVAIHGCEDASRWFVVAMAVDAPSDEALT